ncbi:hypothetical protein Tco_0666557 [Tanacetum coccineum]
MIEVVRCRTLTTGNDKRKEMDASSKQGSTWKDNKKYKIGLGFVATVPPRNNNVNTYPKCAKCYTFHPENAPLAVVNAVMMGRIRGLLECWSLDHLCYDCPSGKCQLDRQWEPVGFGGKQEHPTIGNQARGKGILMEISKALIRSQVVIGFHVVIVCHEKVVEIPIEEGGILQVYRERIWNAAKALMNAKIDEPRISDIPMVRDFTDVFSNDLLGLPPQRQVEFHIDFVPGATPIAKSPYRLAPSKMQELFGKL